MLVVTTKPHGIAVLCGLCNTILTPWPSKGFQMPGCRVYDHVTTAIGCHMIGKPIA